MFIKSKKGQSTLEYVLLVSGVIVALIAFTQSNDYGMKAAVNRSLDDAKNSMTTVTGRISNGYGESAACPDGFSAGSINGRCERDDTP